jgi:hypothetical protein
VEEELLTLPENLSSPPVFSGVSVTRSLVVEVVLHIEATLVRFHKIRDREILKLSRSLQAFYAHHPELSDSSQIHMSKLIDS